MKRFYDFAANILVAVHVVVAIFILVGWMFKDIQPLYVPILVAWPLSWVILGYCPLTKWELLLRKKNDSTIDPNTEKIQYLAAKYLHIDLPSRPIFIGGILVFFGLFILSLSNNSFVGSIAIPPLL